MLGDYEKFKKSIFSLTQIDLSSYKENQMRRRIDTLINKNKITSYDEYVSLIKQDKEKFEQFVNFLTINVSEFYRNPEQWKQLENKVIPDLIQRFGKNLKIWSAACSTGDEPYSLVMAFSRHLPLNQIKIIATDIDKQVIDTARRGLYNAKSIASVPDEFKRKYFTKEDIYKKFNQALTKDGILFIGSTEQILNYKELHYNRNNAFFFSKE